jgi:hypothetical protein
MSQETEARSRKAAAPKTKANSESHCVSEKSNASYGSSTIKSRPLRSLRKIRALDAGILEFVGQEQPAIVRHASYQVEILIRVRALIEVEAIEATLAATSGGKR